MTKITLKNEPLPHWTYRYAPREWFWLRMRCWAWLVVGFTDRGWACLSTAERTRAGQRATLSELRDNGPLWRPNYERVHEIEDTFVIDALMARVDRQGRNA